MSNISAAGTPLPVGEFADVLSALVLSTLTTHFCADDVMGIQLLFSITLDTDF